MFNLKYQSRKAHRLIVFSSLLAFCLMTVFRSSTLIVLTNLLRSARETDVNNAHISRYTTIDDITGFNPSHVFKPLNGKGIYSYYNVCIEERQPVVNRSTTWGFWGTPSETQRIVIYRGRPNQHNNTLERRDISVVGTRSWMWKDWELYFTNAPIPSSHKLLPTTAFFFSESTPNNLYHVWNDYFLQLFSVVRDTNRLHPGMHNQILYRNPRSHFNLSDPGCKYCRRSPYDIIQQTLHTTDKFFVFSELPANTCFSSAVFGTRYSGRRIRDGIDYVLKELKLSYKPRSKYKNILLVQRQYRRILNIDDLAQEARRIGFKNVTVVDLEQMSVLEQMSTIINTDILIGVQGAALQWGIFMRPGSTLIEISWPKKYWGSCYYFVVTYGIKFIKLEITDVFVNWEQYEKHWRKVNSSEVRASMLVSKPRSGHDNIWKYADISVNVKQFRRLLNKLL